MQLFPSLVLPAMEYVIAVHYLMQTPRLMQLPMPCKYVKDRFCNINCALSTGLCYSYGSHKIKIKT